MLASLMRRAVTTPTRLLSTTSTVFVKQINMIEEGNKIVVEGEYKPSPRENYLIPEAKAVAESQGPCPCPLCRLGLHIQHTDVLVLRQFVDSKGIKIPRNITGLCKPQHKRIDYLLVMAEKAGLMDRYFNKSGEKRELVGWEKENKYYDESVIEEFVLNTSRRFRA